MIEKKPIPFSLQGKRLDEAAAILFGLSRSAIQKAIREKRLLYDDAVPKKTGEHVREGSVVSLTLPPLFSQPANLFPKPEILFENADFLVGIKPIGIPTHRDAHHEDSFVTRVQGAGIVLASLGGPQRPGVVHRLDKDTSGLLIVAKTEDAYRFFQQLFLSRSLQKIYTALVHGTDLPDEASIDSPIERDPIHRKKMRLAPEGKGRSALTHFWTENREKGRSLLRLQLVTGRTHQIRLHCSAIGHPILGDVLYGDPARDRPFSPNRLFLHATRLSFVGMEGHSYDFVAPCPFSGGDVFESRRQ